MPWFTISTDPGLQGQLGWGEWAQQRAAGKAWMLPPLMEQSCVFPRDGGLKAHWEEVARVKGFGVLGGFPSLILCSWTCVI